MDDDDLALRRLTYGLVAELGRAPTIVEAARASDRSVEATLAGWRRLHDAHALVLDDDQTELRMVNPFAAKPTSFRVQAAGRSWFANCAWDAFGIGAALHVDSQIDTTCPDCGDPIHVTVDGGRPDPTNLVFHVLVPAAEWWNDIGYT